MKATTAVARRLRLPVGDPVIRFVRLRLADGEPMAVETNHVPAAIVPGLVEADLAGSWYALLSERYGIEISSGVANLEPAMPDERTAELLAITTAQPCFRVRTIVWDRGGRVVESGESVYRGDDFTLTVELLPAAGAAAQARPRRRAT